MPPNAAQELESVSLRGQHKTAVIVGGTKGIGAAVARLFAKLGCGRVIIFGRDEVRGGEVLEVLKGLAPQDADVNFEFVKGDLANVKGMRASAQALENAVGKEGIDYLVLCQNPGPPSGIITENTDGICNELAVQALSRFALAYLLTIRDVLAPEAIVMSIANPGLSLDSLTVDDLSLRGIRDSGRWKPTFAMDQSKRDSTVLDSWTEEMNIRYPKYRYFHVHPGLVKTETFNVDAFPFPLNWVVWLGLHTFATTPDQFAAVPLYILTSPDATQKLGSGRYFDHRLKPKQLGTWSSNPKNRQELWTKLKEMIGEN
ncbi:hypothetical protein FRB97_006263 [Tulasnella sp. 331]|nr:hypothetical protein FRB97_006263 [Tulasnella sp. 331]